MIGLLILPFSNSRYVPLKLITSNERYYWLPRFFLTIWLVGIVDVAITGNRTTGEKVEKVYVYIVVATTPNDIPRLRLCFRDNLLAFLLGHFRCIGTIEKFSLHNIKIPLMWSRSLYQCNRGFAFFKLAKRIDTRHSLRVTFVRARLAILFVIQIEKRISSNECQEYRSLRRIQRIVNWPFSKAKVIIGENSSKWSSKVKERTKRN